MDASGMQHTAPAAVARMAAPLQRAAQALANVAQHLEAWLARRQRTAADLQTLANMSDYELRDVGLHRLDTLESGRALRTTVDNFGQRW